MLGPGEAPTVLLCANTGTQHYTYGLCTEPHNQTQIKEKKGREKTVQSFFMFYCATFVTYQKKKYIFEYGPRKSSFISIETIYFSSFFF